MKSQTNVRGQIKMENRANALQTVTHSLIESTKQFFALEEPAQTMPANQLRAFTAQAFDRHYRVALFFEGEATPLAGHLTRQLGDDRFLFQAYRSNLYRVVSFDQLRYIQRV
ncbi:MAG: hypothetical protein LKJ46_02055 [Lactobacillus sp.]|jgi:hypothetical protein|nr:hypothetical protein [Lactobacillus sp.]MCI1971386.1 hypothetical protein [Lactobacillus sp.]